MKFSVVTSVLGLASMAVASPLENRQNKDKCIDVSARDARAYVERTIAFWERKGGDRSIEKNAEAIYSKDYKLTSNSIRSSRGLPSSSSPVYSSRKEWVDVFKKDTPVVRKAEAINYYIDCNTLVLFQRFESGDRRNTFQTQTIEIQTLEKSKEYGIRAKSAAVEFDSVTWGRASGGKYTPPKN